MFYFMYRIKRFADTNAASKAINNGRRYDMNTTALILAIIGALNWGIIGLFRFDLVAWIFGGQVATVSRIIYTLVGLAGIWCISLLFKRRFVSDKA